MQRLFAAQAVGVEHGQPRLEGPALGRFEVWIVRVREPGGPDRRDVETRTLLDDAAVGPGDREGRLVVALPMAARPTLSLLRLSAIERLLGVAGVILALWALVWLVLE